MKFEIVRRRSKTEPFFWRIVASNGQTLATSEMYVRKASPPESWACSARMSDFVRV